MMNKTRNFTKVGTLYLIANVFEKATAFFLLPILTRLLSTTDYGITSTYQSYLDILGVIIGLSLTNSLRGAIVDYKDSLNEYLSSILFLETLSSLAFTILIVFVGRFVFPNQYHILVVICPVHAFASIIISGLSLKCMLEGRYILRTILSVAPPFISIFTSIILIKSMSDNLYLGRVFGMFSVYAVFGIICYCGIMIRGRGALYVKDSLPLIFHGLSLIVLHQMDRIMLTSLYSAAETGIYSVAYSFGTISLAFVTAMNDVWVPWFYSKMNTLEYDSINKVGRIFNWTCVLLSLGVMLLSPDVMKLFTNSSYWSGIPVVAILVVGNYFYAICTLPINVLYYTKKTKMIATSSVIAMILNLVLNWLLIPKYGAMGASVATIASYLTLFALQYISGRAKQRELFEITSFFLPLFVVIVSAVITTLTLDHCLIRWGIVFASTGCFLFVGIKKWNIIELVKNR